MSAHTTEDAFQAVKKSLAEAEDRNQKSIDKRHGKEPYVCATVGLKIVDLRAVLDELEAFRAAKSEHRRTRREIRRLAKFVTWEPASMVEERERLKQALKYEGDVAAQATADLKKARTEVDELKARLEASCIETSRHWHKANGCEIAHAMVKS